MSSSSTTSTNNLQEHTALDYGISIDGLRTLLAERDEKCAHLELKNWWTTHWCHTTLPSTHTLVLNYDATGQYHYQYTNLTTGEQSAIEPAGTRSIVQLMVDDGRGIHVQAPTHFVSFPFPVPFDVLIEMLETAVSEYENQHQKKAYLFLDLFSSGYHPGKYINSREPNKEFNAWLLNVRAGMQKMDGGLLCCNLDWNSPNHLKRSWMLWEAYTALAQHRPLELTLSSDESQKLADHLREHGPNTILNVVGKLEANPKATEQTNVSKDENLLIPEMRRIAKETFPNDEDPNRKMSQALANATRQAYAEAADRVYRIDIANTAAMQSNLSFAAKTIDLGHQIALLHDITGNLSRAEEIYLEILPFIPSDVVFANIPIDLQDCRTERHKEIRNHHKVAARDKTVAELASVLRQQHKHDAADAAIKHWLQSELPLSFRGVSVTFLENFVHEHNQDLNWLSTNACVERLIKPKTKGQALIELTPHDCIGPKNAKDDHFIFVSHAWLQNFHISGNAWKGGLIQAIVDNTLEHLKAKTYVWLDLFSINQHQTTMAFGFDPLRNVIKEVNEVNINLQTWDDSLPLTRVWCLEEMHNAILFGKEVSKYKSEWSTVVDIEWKHCS